MATTTNTTEEAPPDQYANLTKTQRLAALLLLLQPENAVEIMKRLDEEELETVTSEMSKFKTIGHELQAEILKDFSSVAVEAGTTVSVNVDTIQNLLEKSIGRNRASDIISRVSPARAPATAMQQILEMDARHIFNQLRYEQPQTIAVLVSYLTPEKASQILSLMRSDLREQVVERLATLSPTSADVVENIVEVMHRKLAGSHARTLSQTGGTKAAAEILNALPNPVNKAILTSITERNPDLGDAIVKKMFTFEELYRLDNKSLQKVLQQVDFGTLAIALKTASERLKNALMACVSKRAAQNLREELAFMGPVKLKDIEAAQFQIITIVRNLEAEGQIDLDEMRQKGRH